MFIQDFGESLLPTVDAADPLGERQRRFLSDFMRRDRDADRQQFNVHRAILSASEANGPVQNPHDGSAETRRSAQSPDGELAESLDSHASAERTAEPVPVAYRLIKELLPA